MSGDDEALEKLENLNTEIELIEASLLPAESIVASSLDTLARTLDLSSSESTLRLFVQIDGSYPKGDAVHVEIKGDDVGREEAEGWRVKVEGMMQDWDDQSETPLYTIMTAHFLPLLSATQAPPLAPTEDFEPRMAPVPHHALITTHHLLSPTKRKLLLQLSSELNLVGFSKTGHPGILYAIGEKEDIAEWLIQVKSWNWLALKVRITCEPVPLYPEDFMREQENEAVGGQEKSSPSSQKARGDWVELEKLAESLEWMKKRGREKLLVDAGVGSSTQ